MNYDLLKLSKILPTLQGKKTIDVYQERLEKARQAKKASGGIKPDNSPFQFRTVEIPLVSESLKKELAIKDVKSVDRLLTNKFNLSVDNYENLKTLLQGIETGNDLATIFKASPQHKKVKIGNQPQTTRSNFFGKKNLVEAISFSRPITSNTQSNFVFKKKKITLRHTNETNHIYQYTLGRGFSFFNGDQFGLNGQKVLMKSFSNDVIVDQQKQYLKNLKIDPMTTFHSPNKVTCTEESQVSENKWPAIGSPVGKEKDLHIKSNYKFTSPRAKKNPELSNSNSPVKMNTLVLDGTAIKSSDQDQGRLSPGKSPKFF